ncbi:MAG TPA: hypothetical protein VN132_15285, partial [Bdellovibrio sp.]|nr:hypothetical protein [Bdellovibrio sp.]
MLYSLLGLFFVFPAHAGYPERSLAQTPLAQLYGEDLAAPAKTKFFAAFFSLLPTLRERQLNLNRWFQEDHVVYLADFLSDEEKLQMIP